MSLLQVFSLPVVFDRANRTVFGGLGRLAGDPAQSSEENDGRAKILNTPGRVDIVLLEPGTYQVVARTTSREDGTWQIAFVDTEQQFTVIGVDPMRAVNSAIQDWVYPAPME